MSSLESDELGVPAINSSTSARGQFPDVGGVATPRPRAANTATQAFQLATENAVKIQKLYQDINNPQWARNLSIAQSSLNRKIEFILLTSLIFLLALACVVIIVLYFQLNNVLVVLEDIRDNNKQLGLNNALIDSYNQFFYHARSIINFSATIIGSFGTIAGLGFLIVTIAAKIKTNKQT